MAKAPKRAVSLTEPPNEDVAKRAADQWFAVFFIVRARYPQADVWAQIAATDYALRTK